MKRNKIIALAITGALAFLSADAFACSKTAWSVPGPAGALAGEPDDGGALAVKRYSGRCGLKGSAANDFVTDNLPSAETTYRARFYVFPSGAATVFRVTDADANAGAEVMNIAYNGTAFVATLAGGGATQTVTAAVSKWYAIEINWAKGNGSNGSFGWKIQGAGSITALTDSLAAPVVTNLANPPSPSSASLGLIAGSATVETDAFESRRSTAIGRLCRGDANNDNLVSVADRIVATNDFLNVALATGQPDANEDGIVSTADRIIITNRFLNVAGFGGPACP